MGSYFMGETTMMILPPLSIEIGNETSTPYKSIQKIVWYNIPPFAILTGPNGSGKTQLLQVLAMGLSYQKDEYRLIDMPLNIVGAEIGCYEGSHAFEMLSSTNTISKLHLVDIATFDVIYEKLQDFENRVEYYIPMSSEEASTKLPDKCLDFCYIDADHTYENCSNDIKLWWQKVKDGGILCGHDFTVEMLGTIKAVLEFALRNNLQLNYSVAYDPKTKENVKSDWWVHKT